MLKKAASGLLITQTLNVLRGYASGLHSLRLC